MPPKDPAPTEDLLQIQIAIELDRGRKVAEIASEFQVPEKSCYVKIPNPASRYALVGVYIAQHKKEVICAVTGAQPVVYRCKEIEKELNNNLNIDDFKLRRYS